MTSLDAALDYASRGWAPIPLELGGKKPRARAWQNARHTVEELPKQFSNGANIGVLTGAPSGGLVDVDLDTPEAAALAPTFLPDTAAVFGRDGKPRSHCFYLASIPKTIRYQHPTARTADGKRVTLLELRSTGGQTMVPPSVHPSGEVVRWDESGEPAAVEASELLRDVGQLAAAALVAQAWPQSGARHDLALALAGVLLGWLDWDDEPASEFIRAVAEVAGDEEVEDRVAAVATTRACLAEGKAYTGLAHLGELLDKRVVRRIVQWLGGSMRNRAAPAAQGTYAATDGGMVLRRTTEHGAVQEIPLSNFAARITAERIDDDGTEAQVLFALEVQRRGRVRTGEVAAGDFASMAWVARIGGAECIQHPAPYARDHLRAAIQTVSLPVPEERRYTHTGWRDDLGADIGPVYLHAAGALGAKGSVPGVEVRLPAPLAPLELPEPPADPRPALRASLGMLGVAPLGVTLPVFATIYRVVLGGMDASAAIVGPTGAGKSELAALAQQHFGPGFAARHLPGNWSGTANFTEGLGFAAKDALCVVDDWAPGAGRQNRDKLEAAADRLFRNQGNRAGRGRMRADGTLRPEKAPRGMFLMTGEDLPAGQSVRARIAIVELGPEAMDWRVLSSAQADAAAGRYAEAMAGYICWLAGRYDAMRAALPAQVAALRARAAGQHRRTPDLVAQLAMGLRSFADYAVSAGLWTAAEADASWEAWWTVLQDVGERQVIYQSGADPARRFVELVGVVVASGAGHFATFTGEAPADDPERWGWRLRTTEAGTRWEDGQYLDALGSPVAPVYVPQGPRLGWLDPARGHLLLVAEACYAAAQRLAREGPEGLTVGLTALKKRLHEAGYLEATETRGGKTYLEVRRGIAGARVAVLVMRADVFAGEGATSEGEGATDSTA
ncbi:MAG: bifunctional DNA primase/polymerase [Gemmatimonadales bacterium]